MAVLDGTRRAHGCGELLGGERQVRDDLSEKGVEDGDGIIVFKVLLACGRFSFPAKKTLQGPKN